MYEEQIARATERRDSARAANKGIRAAAEGRALTASEATELQASQLEERGAQDQLEQSVQRLIHENQLNDARSRFSDELDGADRLRARDDADERRSQEGPDAFQRVLDGDASGLELPSRAEARAFAEARNLNTGTPSEGGDLVPTTMSTELYVAMEKQAGLLSVAGLMTTDSGEPFDLPVGSIDDAAVIVSEGGTIAATDPSFSKITFGAHKYGTLVHVSSELLADGANGLASYIGAELGHRIGRGLGPHLATGDGSGKPTGIVTAATTAVTAAAPAAIATDELYDLQHSVRAAYRGSAVWVMNDTTLNAIRKLKDADGRYLLEPSMAAGSGSMILGHRVVVDAYMPDLGAGNSPVAFGDMSKFRVRQAGRIRVEASEHARFLSDVTTWRALARFDSKLIDNDAVTLLTNAA